MVRTFKETKLHWIQLFISKYIELFSLWAIINRWYFAVSLMFAKLIIQKFWDPVLISLIKIFNIFLFTGYKTTASHYIHRWNRYEGFFFYLKTFRNFKYVLVNEIYFSQLLDIVFINLWSVWQLVGKRLVLLLYCDLSSITKVIESSS